MRLLWVENHARFVAVALQTLLQAYEVRVARSLLEAGHLLAADTFDAVLIDYDLDDGKGTELLPLLLSPTERPLLIAVSSHAEGNSRLMAAGTDRVCSKMEFARIESVLTPNSV